ncbi:MAG: hypothetical protein VSS52_001550, partial [Thiotrichaceae bacterium]|nr:hypothetical protein [Thiotrichaceae bacterium]
RKRDANIKTPPSECYPTKTERWMVMAKTCNIYTFFLEFFSILLKQYIKKPSGHLHKYSRNLNLYKELKTTIIKLK